MHNEGVNTAFVTVDDKGRILIPEEIQQAIGIQPGDRVLVQEEVGRVVVRRVSEADARRAIAQLRGITCGGPSMSDELIAERREDDRKAGW
jgi:AbrB family looped-hinge helix DNA binding protein